MYMHSSYPCTLLTALFGALSAGGCLQTLGRDQQVYWGDVQANQPVSTHGLWTKPQITNEIAWALFSCSGLHTIDLSGSLVTRSGLEKLVCNNEKLSERKHAGTVDSVGNATAVLPPDKNAAADEDTDSDSGSVFEGTTRTWEDFVSSSEEDGHSDGITQQTTTPSRDENHWWDVDCIGFDHGHSGSSSDDSDGTQHLQSYRRQHRRQQRRPPMLDHERHWAQGGGGTKLMARSLFPSSIREIQPPNHFLRRLVLRNCFRLEASALVVVARYAPGLELLDLSGSLRWEDAGGAVEIIRDRFPQLSEVRACFGVLAA